MKHFFKKELVNNTFVAKGKPVPFEVLVGNSGAIALDDEKPTDADLIFALGEAADQGRGGIVRLSEAQYEELKKKQPPISYGTKSAPKETLRVLQQPQNPFKHPEVAPPADAGKTAKPDGGTAQFPYGAPQQPPAATPPAQGLPTETVEPTPNNPPPPLDLPPIGQVEKTAAAPEKPAEKVFQPQTARVSSKGIEKVPKTETPA